MPSEVKTSIVTADGAVTSTHATVWWVMVAAGATGGAWQLNDSTDDSGTDKLRGIAQANSNTLLNITDAPIKFGTGVFADIQGSNVTLTVGYTN